ncbi:hypothetical protein ACVWYG_002987 [Pedobacter sp. UYEF25]
MKLLSYKIVKLLDCYLLSLTLTNESQKGVTFFGFNFTVPGGIFLKLECALTSAYKQYPKQNDSRSVLYVTSKDTKDSV